MCGVCAEAPAEVYRGDTRQSGGFPPPLVLSTPEWAPLKEPVCLSACLSTDTERQTVTTWTRHNRHRKRFSTQGGLMTPFLYIKPLSHIQNLPPTVNQPTKVVGWRKAWWRLTCSVRCVNRCAFPAQSSRRSRSGNPGRPVLFCLDSKAIGPLYQPRANTGAVGAAPWRYTPGRPGRPLSDTYSYSDTELRGAAAELRQHARRFEQSLRVTPLVPRDPFISTRGLHWERQLQGQIKLSLRRPRLEFRLRGALLRAGLI
ncbi:hypothetical protein Bbelb_195760 [Branchiostoma belcheri]|nr:hypothetical protein Bbelb_195760 [Branchiostoma belcheri]